MARRELRLPRSILRRLYSVHLVSMQPLPPGTGLHSRATDVALLCDHISREGHRGGRRMRQGYAHATYLGDALICHGSIGRRGFAPINGLRILVGSERPAAALRALHEQRSREGLRYRMLLVCRRWIRQIERRTEMAPGPSQYKPVRGYLHLMASCTLWGGRWSGGSDWRRRLEGNGRTETGRGN